MAQRFAKVLERGGNPNLKWQYEHFPDETHATIFHPAALRAFRGVFKPAPHGTGAYRVIGADGTRLLIDPWIDGNAAAPE